MIFFVVVFIRFPPFFRTFSDIFLYYLVILEVCARISR